MNPKKDKINFIFGLWDNKPMPRLFKKNIEIWKKLNPHNEICIWKKQECESLLQKLYPEIVPVYEIASPIQRADLARYIILHANGGWYADCDTVPTLSVDEIRKSISIEDPIGIAFTETIIDQQFQQTTSRLKIRNGLSEYKIRVANYVFWSKIDSPWLLDIMKLAAIRLRKHGNSPSCDANWTKDYHTIYTTGPDVMTEITFDRNTDKCYHGIAVVQKAESLKWIMHQAAGNWRKHNLQYYKHYLSIIIYRYLKKM